MDWSFGIISYLLRSEETNHTKKKKHDEDPYKKHLPSKLKLYIPLKWYPVEIWVFMDGGGISVYLCDVP